MAYTESPLAVALKGAVAGLAGTAALTAAMQGAALVLQQQGARPEETPARAAQESTAKLADKVAGGVLETDLEEGQRSVAGQSIHWLYGAGWGALYGIVQASVRLPHLVGGTLLGGVVAGVASTLVPAMRLTPPPSQQPAGMKVSQAAFHLVYGWVVALVFRALSADA